MWMYESIERHFLRVGVGIELGDIPSVFSHKTGIIHDLGYGVKKESEEF